MALYISANVPSVMLPSRERSAIVWCSRDKAEPPVVSGTLRNAIECECCLEGWGIKIVLWMMFPSNLKDRRHHLLQVSTV